MKYFGYFSFFTIHLELKRQIRLYVLKVPLKTLPDLRPSGSGQNLYPFSDQNGSKTIPFGAAHTYIAYIGEYPPPPNRVHNLLLIRAFTCLVPRPLAVFHLGPFRITWSERKSGRSSRIRHRNEFTVRAWEKAVQGLTQPFLGSSPNAPALLRDEAKNGCAEDYTGSGTFISLTEILLRGMPSQRAERGKKPVAYLFVVVFIFITRDALRGQPVLKNR